MEKKYEITINGRIRALRDIESIGVKAGDLGGTVDSESNLSQDGDCWIFPDAKVIEKAVVSGDAVIERNAIVQGKAKVTDTALVMGMATIDESAVINKNALINGNIWIYGTAHIGENTGIFDGIIIGGDSVIENAYIYGGCSIENTIIKPYNICHLRTGEGKIFRGAIREKSDFMCCVGLGSVFRTTNIYKERVSGKIVVSCGCFYGTLRQFKKKVKKTYRFGHKHRREYLALIKAAKAHF